MATQYKPDPKTDRTASDAREATSQDASAPEDFIKVMGNKTPSKYTDPCAKAAKLSIKCLDDNAYDRSKCGALFNQYRDCKKAWVLQRRHDRLNNRPGAFD